MGNFFVRQTMVIITGCKYCETERRRTTEQWFKPILRSAMHYCSFNEHSQSHCEENHVC